MKGKLDRKSTERNGKAGGNEMGEEDRGDEREEPGGGGGLER